MKSIVRFALILSFTLGLHAQQAGLPAPSFASQVAGLSGQAVRSTNANILTNLATHAISLNHFYFNDGTDGWHAGIAYTGCGAFVADTMVTMMNNPSYFTPAQELNMVKKLDGAKNGAGQFPTCIAADGTMASSAFYSAWDLHHAFAATDGTIAAPIFLWYYYQQTGDVAPYKTYVADLKTAWASYPKNSSNHLITVVPGNEYVPCFGYMEQQRFNSDNACASIFYAFDLYVLHKMAVVAGDSTNASFFQTEYNLVAPAILTEFTDGTTQMLNAASAGTGAQNVQIDVLSSTLAVWLETQAPGFSLIGSSQAASMSSYLATNNSTLVNNGFIRQFAAACGTIGIIPAGGGPPYNSSPYTNTQYQCGDWGFTAGWYNYVLNKTATGGALVPTNIQAYNTFSSAMCGSYSCGEIEWLNVGSSAAPSGATAVLMSSPLGNFYSQANFPAPLPVPAGGGCINCTITGNGFPFTIIQEENFSTTANNATFVMTFPHALQASGATAWLMCALDGSQTPTYPTGWTVDLDVPAATYSRLTIMHKTSAGDTSATVTYGSGSSGSCYFAEMSGTRTLDASATGTSANADSITPPSITPTAGAAVFALECNVTAAGAGGDFYQTGALRGYMNYRPLFLGNSTNQGRTLIGYGALEPASGVATRPPVIWTQGGGSSGLFTGGGIAYASFSIK